MPLSSSVSLVGARLSLRQFGARGPVPGRMSAPKASLFRRVSAWAASADPAAVVSYLDTVQQKQNTVHESQRRGLRWMVVCIALLELCLASAVQRLSIGPLEVQNLQLVVLALPGVIAFCVSGILGAGVTMRLLAVSEHACIRVRYRIEWLLGIDVVLHHLSGLQDHHLESWGQPISSSRTRRAYASVLWLYTRLVGVVLLLYAPVAIVRAGRAFGFGHPMLWTAAVVTALALSRAVLAHAYAHGASRLDEDLPPLAHLMADEDVLAWQRKAKGSNS